MEEGSLVRVVYEFQTDVLGELPLNVGDVLQVKYRIDKQWLYARCGETEGAIPERCVIEVSMPEIKDNQKIFAATADFPGQQIGDLCFKRGDIIIGLNAIDANWWRGSCNGLTGIFPITYVWSPDMSKLNIKRTKKVNFYAKAKMDLIAQLPEEIDLKKDDVVHVTEVIDKNWYRGECNGHIGTFPSAFVTILSQPDPENAAKFKSTPSRTTSLDTPAANSSTKLEHTFSIEKNNHISSNLDCFENCDSFGYDSLNSGITPYGRTLYPFTGQFSNELSFKKGEIITLIRHISEEWIEGELNGKIGRFPTSFIKIIVDCPENSKKVAVNNNNACDAQSTNKDTYEFPKDTYGRVLYDFNAEIEGDLTLKVGDTVTLIRQLDKDWYEAVTDDGNIGICPANFLEIIGGTPGDYRKSGSSEEMGTSFDNNNIFIGAKFSNDAFTIDSKSLDTSIASNLATLDLTLKNKNAANNADNAPAHHFDLSSPKGYGTWPALRQNTLPSEGRIENVRWSLPCPPSKSEESRRSVQRARSLSSPLRPAPPPPMSRQSSNSSLFGDSENSNMPKPFPRDQEAAVSKAKEEEMRRREEEKRRKMKEQRSCVIMEMVQTERDYLHDLKVCQDVFLSNPSTDMKFASIKPLFGNLDEIIVVSERLLNNLQRVQNSMNGEMIGDSFISMSEELKEAYGHYCRNHDDTHTLLEKLESQPEVKRYLDNGLEKMKETTNCFDLPSVLIKPVQRILKYPLLLNELIKCTEESHPDHKSLLKAVNVMTDVANDINEFKRRKDLVFKYRKEADSSFSTRIAKLNMHSVLKKYSRFGVKVYTSLGLASVTKDEDFDKMAKKFNSIEKAMKIFLKNLGTFMGHMKDCAMNALYTSEDIGLYFQEKSKQLEVDQLRTTQRLIATQYYDDFNVAIERNVISILNQLLQTYHCPQKLIQKRYDKFLDYGACKSRLERNKDPSKQKTLENELQLAKSNYEALNGQLLEELPKLCSLSVDVFQDCLLAFLRARKIFIGRCAKQMLTLMELPLLMGTSRDIIETFQVKHSIIVNQLVNLTLVPKSLLSTSSSSGDASVSKHPSRVSPTPSAASSFGTLGRASQRFPQSQSQRVYIQNQYPLETLYTVTDKWIAIDVLDLNLEKGDLVSVIKKQDPMGQSHRWFVDNGASKGFVPSKFLSKYTTTRQPAPQVPPAPATLPRMQARRTETLNQDTSFDSLPTYEDVMQEGVSSSQTSASNTAATESQVSIPDKPEDVVSHRYYEIPDSPEDTIKLSSTSELMGFQNLESSPASGQNHDGRYMNIDEFDPFSPVASSSLYDNVPCVAEPTRTPASQVYDTVLESDTAHSSISSASPKQSNLPSSQSPERFEPEGQDSPEYFYARYSFDAMGPSQLNLSLGQVVLVRHKQDLHGNSEWWYVEDRYGNLGYVPAAYLTSYKT